jgi:hypothetical protein
MIYTTRSYSYYLPSYVVGDGTTADRHSDAGSSCESSARSFVFLLHVLTNILVIHRRSARYVAREHIGCDLVVKSSPFVGTAKRGR